MGVLMKPTIQGLDRVSIAVENLEVARASFAALGFTLAPRSRHVGQGTGNYTIALSGVAGDGAYIELLAQIDAHQEDASLVNRLNLSGEGLLSLGLKTQDVEAAQSALDLGDPVQTHRAIHADGMTKMASFNLLSVLDSVKNRPSFDLVEHMSPELVFQPDLMAHENLATGIREIHVRSDSVRDEVMTCAPYCTPAQTDAQARQVDALMDGSRVARLTFLSDKAWGDLYGKNDAATAGLVIECSNAIEAKAYLESAGFAPEFVNSRLNGYRLPVEKTHGVWITFVAE